MTETKLFMNLIKHRLCERKSNAPCSSALTSDTVQELMALARRHDLTAIVGSELLEEDLISSDCLKNSIHDAVCQAACYCEIMNHELQWLCDILEEALIPHMVLKGGLIRDYYPEPWLRTSGDIDILIPEEVLENAVALLLEKGCIIDAPRRYHDVPLKTPGQNLLELHFNIREDIPILDDVLDTVWEHCELVPGKMYEYRQTTEFLLFHMLAHMSYHLIHGGCGIRSFVDIWLLHQKEKWDTELLHNLLSQARLENFYDNVMALNGVWFAGNNHNEVTQLLQELVIDGGTFGTREKEILMEQAQAGNRVKYILHRIFMPYPLLKKQYPILDKHPVLLPCCQFLRWIRILTGNRKTALKEMQTSCSHSDAQIQKTQQTLKQIGIDY